MNEKGFEELDRNEQIAKLDAIKKTIQQNFIDNKQNFEIIDVVYNKLSDEKIVYEVLCKDFETDEEKNLLYSIDEENKIKPYRPIDVEKIKAMQAINEIATDENYQKKAQVEREEIERLSSNKTKKSLNKLIEQEQQKNELEKLGNSLKIDSNDIKECTKIEGEKELTDEDIKGYSSTNIGGMDKASSKFTLNQILGMQYQNYKILQDSNGYAFMVGQKSDGMYEIIDPNKYEVLSSSPEMSLASGDGNIRNVKVEVGIRVKGLSSESDQCIGIYHANDKYGTFYARGYNSNEKMIGAEIESEPYIKSNTTKAQEIVDRRDNNSVDDEQHRIEKIEENNSYEATKIYDVYDNENPNNNKSSNYEDKSTNDYKNNDYDDKNPNNNEKSDNEDKYYMDEEENEHSRGTPWGNPNANKH